MASTDNTSKTNEISHNKSKSELRFEAARSAICASELGSNLPFSVCQLIAELGRQCLNPKILYLFNGGDDTLTMLKKAGDDFIDVDPDEALCDAKVIAIFFSAHWCPV